ncbi:Uncharacterised protein [Mycobacteroides abscessus]|nr:Uncharacterised protein [Mycobacteroides abscessus]
MTGFVWRDYPGAQKRANSIRNKSTARNSRGYPPT